MKKFAIPLISLTLALAAGAAFAERVPTPEFTQGQVALGDGTKVWLNPTPCMFGEGQGFHGLPVLGKTKASGCWRQQGHIIFIEVKALVNDNGIFPFPGPEYIVDVPDAYYN